MNQDKQNSSIMKDNYVNEDKVSSSNSSNRNSNSNDNLIK